MSFDPSNIPNTKPGDESGDARSPAERLAYLGLDAADQRRLRRLIPAFEAFTAELVETFYRHLFAFEESARFLHDPELVARLKRAQQDHFLSLLEAEWGPDYDERRRRVGQAHAQVGIDPALFLGAYNEYVQQSFRRYLGDSGRPLSAEIESLLSLLKVVFLDLGLTLEAYFSRATQTIRLALDMYWKANIELRQFAHLTSHDLKTPLATVANFCDEALDEFGEQMPAEAKKLIESARQRTFRMSRMIDELLATATTFEPADRLAETSSQAALTVAVDRLRPEMLEKQIDLDLPKSPPVVQGDAVRLRESFYNVLSNAVKYIDRIPGKITICVEPCDDGYEFTIEDNGPGIPPEDLQSIFAPFRRSSRPGARPGSGLGLYFTRTMIEHLGGRVWAESQPGRGSRFHIVLRRPPGV
jgi:signal transduction histidine kinase